MFKLNWNITDVFVFLVFFTIISNIAFSADVLISITSPIYSIVFRLLMVVSFFMWIRNLNVNVNAIDVIIASIIIWQLMVMMINENAGFEGFYNIVTWPCVFAVSYRESMAGRLEQKKIGYIVIIAALIAVLIHQFRTVRMNQIYLAFYLPLLLPFVFEKNNQKLTVVSATITLALILYSYKRSGVLIVGTGLLVYYLTDIKDVSHFRDKVKKLLTLAIIFSIIWYVVLCYADGWAVYHRFQNLQDDGGSGRFDIYNRCFEILRKESFFSFIFGNGYKGASKLLNGFAGAHNDYLEILIDYGLIGLLSTVAFIGFVIRSAVKARRINNIKLAPLYSELIMCFIVSMESFLLWQSFLMVAAGFYLGYKLGEIKRKEMRQLTYEWENGAKTIKY